MIYERNILEGIKKALENAYVYIDNEEIEDINFTDFMGNSLQFMAFIVELEEVFTIEFPPELLLLNNFANIETLYPIIIELKKK